MNSSEMTSSSQSKLTQRIYRLDDNLEEVVQYFQQTNVSPKFLSDVVRCLTTWAKDSETPELILTPADRKAEVARVGAILHEKLLGLAPGFSAKDCLLACARFHSVEAEVHKSTHTNVQQRMSEVLAGWAERDKKYPMSNTGFQDMLRVMALHQAGLAKAKLRFVTEDMCEQAEKLAVRALRIGGPDFPQADECMVLLSMALHYRTMIKKKNKELEMQGKRGLEVRDER